MLDPVTQFNRIEIFLWVALGLISLIFGDRITGMSPRNRWLLGLSLFAFAFSDWVELRSRAWWRPWWLLVLKGACLTVFAGVGFAFRRSMTSR